VQTSGTSRTIGGHSGHGADVNGPSATSPEMVSTSAKCHSNVIMASCNQIPLDQVCQMHGLPLLHHSFQFSTRLFLSIMFMIHSRTSFNMYADLIVLLIFIAEPGRSLHVCTNCIGWWCARQLVNPYHAMMTLVRKSQFFWSITMHTSSSFSIRYV
jgi:hypothetical protein